MWPHDSFPKHKRRRPPSFDIVMLVVIGALVIGLAVLIYGIYR